MSDHENSSVEPGTQPGAQLKTSINPRWTIKFVIFFVISFGIGAWGAFDALVAYPNRGKYDAEWKLKLYLEQAEVSGRLFNSSVDDPAAELERLQGLEPGDLTPLEDTRMQWLESLALVASLDAISAANEAAKAKDGAGETFVDTATYFDDPASVFAELVTAHSTSGTPKPLSKLDIPVQFIIMGAGVVVATWITFHMLRTRRVSYSYDASTMTLGLPDGRKVTPAMIEDVDKRKWHKFIVSLHFTDNSRPAKLDLLVHVPLEQWVLEMEPHTPNYEPEDEPEDEDDLEDESDAGSAEPDEAPENQDT